MKHSKKPEAAKRMKLADPLALWAAFVHHMAPDGAEVVDGVVRDKLTQRALCADTEANRATAAQYGFTDDEG